MTLVESPTGATCFAESRGLTAGAPGPRISIADLWHPDPMTLRPGARAAFAFNAALAWIGFVLVCVLSATDQYAHVTPAPHEYGVHPGGFAGAISRLFDTLSYFTVWSNVIVAISCTLVAVAPHADTRWRRVVRLDALIMITVTAIVYALLLAPGSHPTGWDLVTNPWQHIAVPLVTVIVWLVWGPRGRIDRRTVASCFAIPGVWIVYMLVRGAVVDAYPYPFVNVDAHGYGSVAVTLVVILLFGLVLALAFWGIDRLLTRRASIRSRP